MKNRQKVFILLFFPVLSLFFLIFRINKVSPKRRKASSVVEEKQRIVSNDRASDTKQRVLHPFLLAIFPALSLVSDNIALLSINWMIVRIATAMLWIATFCFVLLRGIVKDERKAGIMVSHSLLLFSSYGYVFDFFTENFKKIRINHRFLLMVWGVLEILSIRFALSTSAHLRALTEFWNVLAGSLVMMSLVQIAVNKAPKENRQHEQPWNKPATPLTASSASRDIYYIIVDAHASASTLREIYQYNDDGFTRRLREKGFYVANRSRSNYAMTMLSLASSLNGNYLQSSDSPAIRTEKEGIIAAKAWIEENASMRFLKSRGYQIVFLGSGFGITQSNLHADVEITCGKIDETLGRFINSSLIRAVADKKNWIKKDKRNRVLCMFSQLAEVQKLKGPKFVFAHIAAPQWPFLFDGNGDPNRLEEKTVEQKKEAYLNQLIFIDKKIEELIDKILRKSQTEPIIILQSDHGPNFAFDGGYDLQNPSQGILLEKMRILNAYYLPDGGSDSLYETITPVNTFRLIFNQYFDVNLPLLEDQSYFSTLEDPYTFTNVSSLI